MPSFLEIFQYHGFYSFVTIEYLNTIYIIVCRWKHAEGLEEGFVKRASCRLNHDGSLSFPLK